MLRFGLDWLNLRHRQRSREARTLDRESRPGDHALRVGIYALEEGVASACEFDQPGHRA